MKARPPRYLCVDMHVHSDHSPDGSSRVRSIVSKARRLGIGVALTDHNTIGGSLQALDISGEEVVVVPAIEITTAERKDLLIYFYSRGDMVAFYETHVAHHRIPGVSSRTDMTLEEAIHAAGSCAGFTGIPHPYGLAYKNMARYLQRTGKEALLSEVDGMEGINGSLGKAANDKAIRLARQWGKPVFGGSDAHFLGGVGNTLTCSRVRDFRALLDAVAAGDGFILGRRNGVCPILAPEEDNGSVSRRLDRRGPERGDIP